MLFTCSNEFHLYVLTCFTALQVLLLHGFYHCMDCANSCAPAPATASNPSSSSNAAKVLVGLTSDAVSAARSFAVHRQLAIEHGHGVRTKEPSVHDLHVAHLPARTQKSV